MVVASITLPATAASGTLATLTTCGSFAAAECKLADPVAGVEIEPLDVKDTAKLQTYDVLEVEVVFREGVALTSPTPVTKAALVSGAGNGPGPVQFAAQLSRARSASSFLWTDGGVPFSIGERPLTTLSLGPHLISLTIDLLNDKGETVTIAQEMRLIVNPPLELPLVSTGGQAFFIEAGGAAQLLATVKGGVPPYTFEWSPRTDLFDPMGPGSNGARIPNPIAAPQTTTIYTVTVTDAMQHVDRCRAFVVVNNMAPPEPSP
jgi:hypothetical protein